MPTQSFTAFIYQTELFTHNNTQYIDVTFWPTALYQACVCTLVHIHLHINIQKVIITKSLVVEQIGMAID